MVHIWTKAAMILAAMQLVNVEAKSIRWELEDYNDWNLPFAKTVQI